MAPDPTIAGLLSRYARNGLLVDTNLLLLLAVGGYDQRRIESFKRTAVYTRSDYQLLAALVARFRQLLTTPNILTEVDNLGRQLPIKEWPGFAAALRRLSLRMLERARPSMEAMQLPSFSRLGLADTVTLSINEGWLLISDDLLLCLAAQKAGQDAINFNHLRM